MADNVQNSVASGQPAKRKKKSIFKRKRFWIILILILVATGAGFYFFSPKTPMTQYTTEEAKIGNLVQTVSATGAVESSEDVSLSFKAPGKLTLVSVKEGDKVKAGTLLAAVDSASLSATISQYRASLNSAEANLLKVEAGASSQDVQLTAEQLAKAEDDLKNLQADSTAQLQTLQEKNLDALSSADFTAKVALDKVFNYFLNTVNTANLQVSDSSLLNSVVASYGLILKDINAAEILVATAKTQKTNEAILIAADDLRGHLTALNNLLDNAFKLGDAIIVNSNYPQATKDAIKADISGQQTATQNVLAGLQLAKSNLSNAVSSYASQINSAENAVGIAQAQLNLKQAGPRSFDIQSAEASVAQARAQLSGALANSADYKIMAPIDGLVTKVNYNLGELVPAVQPIIGMIAIGKYQIKVDISESDIAKVEVGDKVSINLDAFGSDHLFKGTVTFIDPAQTSIQNVIYYKATVSIDNDDWNSKIKTGMTANTTITTAQKDNVLFVPQRSVKIGATTFDETPIKTVQILVDQKTNKVENRIVMTGLRGDGGNVEILSGLSAGDKVVTFIKTP